MKNIVILGSTGSIGTQALDVIRNHPDKFNIVGLTANTNIDLLRNQVKEFKPLEVSVGNIKLANELMNFVAVPVHHGLDGIIKIATLKEADTVLNALVGSVGVLPTHEAIKHKKNIALANKETLVTAGTPIMQAAKQHNITILPIDSEHSAILQCLNGEKKRNIKKIILTCSGGPFKNATKEQLQNVTRKDALNHPTWSMGAKITIDSSTLMNKGFEVIEAHHLFDIPHDQIDVVIHPQSIIHSFVEFNDTSIIAQLDHPNMRIPIQYALTYPDRIPAKTQALELTKLQSLTFTQPNTELFPCLQLAYDAGKKGKSYPAVLNAANEVAVSAFLSDEIKHKDIPEIIKRALDMHEPIQEPTIQDLIQIDTQIKKETQEYIQHQLKK